MRSFFSKTILGAILIMATPSAALAGAADDWQLAVAKRIAKYQTYPRSALARNIQGRAKVAVVIDRSGALQSYEILTETGERVLDREIPKLMKRIDPLPAPPDDVDGDTIALELPIVWRLR